MLFPFHVRRKVTREGKGGGLKRLCLVIWKNVDIVGVCSSFDVTNLNRNVNTLYVIKMTIGQRELFED
ncbi:MAG: hypothetical protein RIR11_3564 [Bacteroidota bacterium]|jgi:hypothetical protein